MASIQKELKQQRPFPSRTAEAAVALLRTADLVRRVMSDLVEPLGITVQQYNVLRILRGAGADGLPTLEIAERMIEQTPGITRLIDRLEAKALVGRERCPTDRRQVFCRITPDGLSLLASIDAPAAAAQTDALSGVTKKELAQLVAILDRLRDGMHSFFDGGQ
ncbi:MAG: MarR family transcriptional regulator [Acidobacteria bacterium]|nr:MarR family transcriptional regulator [Acidobacteriota bacterium]